jgi:hypothetical protein|tara:strand:- start:34 stop:495 length:462 start_codon:yes stop_codon:yes gene_type:complete
VRKKTKLIPFVDYFPFRNFKERVKDFRNEPTILPPGTINKNSWPDIVAYCQLHGYKPADIYKLIFDRHKPKTKRETIKIAILVHDALKRNEKQKKVLRKSEHWVILSCRKEIIKLNKNKHPTDLQLYRIGKKALERAPQFLLLDKVARKKFGY